MSTPGPRRSWRAGDRLALIAAALAVIALVIVPVIKLTQVVLERGGSSAARVVQAPGFGSALTHTVVLACVVSLLAVPLGSVMALFLRRGDVPGRAGLRLLVVLPLIVPQFVLGYSWTQAYGPAGLTDSLFGLSWSGLHGPVGIVVVLVVDIAPLSYLLTSAGLATRAQPDLERAARVSGASSWVTLRTVTLPLLAPVLAAETVLTFVATAESFAVPQVLGAPAGFSTLTTRIYSDLSLGSNPDSFVDAVTLSLGLVVLAAVVLLPADLLLVPRLRATRTGYPGGGVLATRPTRPAIVPTLVLLAYTVLAVGLPVLALLGAALTKAVGLAPTPSNWTLDNFRTALDGPVVDAIWNSIQLAAVAAVVLTVLGALIAGLERRRAGRVLGTVAIFTFAIPGSALAVGLLIAYGRWFGAGLALILVAYLAKFWALAHRAIAGAVDRLPQTEWQAARGSGANATVAVGTVWLPSLAPALIGAWLLVFLSALHEVTMSSLLYSSGNQTLAVAVLNSQELGDVGTTAALSVVLTAPLLIVVLPGWLVLALLIRRRRGPRAQRIPSSGSLPEVAGAN